AGSMCTLRPIVHPDSVLEKAAASFLVFRDVLVQCRYRHSAHVAYCENSGNLNAQGEPFDVAVKLPREKDCGLQCRVLEIMLFDGSENRLETDDDIQFCCTRGARTGERGCGLLAVSCATAPRALLHSTSQVSSIASGPIT